MLAGFGIEASFRRGWTAGGATRYDSAGRYDHGNDDVPELRKRSFYRGQRLPEVRPRLQIAGRAELERPGSPDRRDSDQCDRRGVRGGADALLGGAPLGTLARTGIRVISNVPKRDATFGELLRKEAREVGSGAIPATANVLEVASARRGLPAKLPAETRGLFI